jgi:hypothetical protein
MADPWLMAGTILAAVQVAIALYVVMRKGKEDR